VGVAVACGLLGHFLRAGGFPAAPLLLGLLLGRLLERAFVQSLQISAGSLTIFLERPIALTLLLVAVLVVVLHVARPLRAAS
jgi:putative tricarboxylic transport membrane protein